MAVIPVPVTQGAQRIGVAQTSRASDTPFQNLRAPDLSGPGRALSSAGQSLQNAGATFQALSDQQQKRSLIAFEEEEAILRETLNQGLLGLKGQDLIDAIEGDQGVMARYEGSLAALRTKYGSDLTGSYAETLDRAARLSSVSYANKVTGAQVEAQLEVDKQLITSRIGHATSAARAAAGSLAQDRAVEVSLEKIRTSVTDPDMGLAKIMGLRDQADIDAMVKVQQGALLGEVVKELQAQGKHSDAAALVKQHTQSGGILDGTEAGTTLQAAIQTQADLQRGTDNFERFWAESGQSPGAVLNSIMAIEDATEQEQTMRAFNSYMGAKATVERDQIGDAIAYLQSYAAGNQGSIEGIDVNRIMPILKHQPQALNAFAYGKQQRTVAQERGAASAAEIHADAGGADRPSSVIESSLQQMAKTSPGDFLAMKPENVRPLLDYDQYQDFLALRVEVEGRLQEAENRGASSYTTAITALQQQTGLPDSVVRALSSSNSLRQNFVEWTRTVLEETGNPPTPDQYRAKLAEYALTVYDNTGEGLFNLEKTSPYILSERQANGENVSNVPLETDGSRQRTLLAFALGVTKKDIDDAIDLLEAGGPLTLTRLRGHFNVPADLVEGRRQRTAFENTAVTMGYNPDFMEWMAQQKGLPMTVASLTALAEAFKTPLGRTEYQTQYERWAGNR